MKPVKAEVNKHGNGFKVTLETDSDDGLFISRENRFGALVSSRSMVLIANSGRVSNDPVPEFTADGILSGNESLEKFLTPDESRPGVYTLRRLARVEFEEQTCPDRNTYIRTGKTTFAPEIGDDVNYEGVEIRELSPPQS